MFNYAIDWTMTKAMTGYLSVQLSPSVCITDLEFADDIVVLGDSPTAMQAIFD